MIKDLLVSFKDNFKEKSTNPFLGTYVIVWGIHNWSLIYSIFNFDKDTKLETKIEFIKSYYSENSFLEGILYNVLWAFGVLIVTYLLLNISRFIVNISEKQLTPWIYKITDSKSIVLKSLHENLRNNRDELQIRLDQEREAKSRLETKIKSLEENITNLLKKGEEDSGNDEKAVNDSLNIQTETDIMFEKIKKKNWSQNLLNAVTHVNEQEHGWVDNNKIDEAFRYFIDLGLFDIAKKDTTDTMLKVSQLGENVLRRIRLDL